MQWIKHYLSKRPQFIRLGGITSQNEFINCWFPQGSVLGPTLFFLYINDLPNSSSFFNFRLFADDSNLFHTYPANHSIDLDIATNHLKMVLQWCDVNKMTINKTKSNYIIFRGKQRQVDVKGSILMRRDTISEVNVVPFVGLLIDKHLKWTSTCPHQNQDDVWYAIQTKTFFTNRHFDSLVFIPYSVSSYLRSRSLGECIFDTFTLYFDGTKDGSPCDDV